MTTTNDTTAQIVFDLANVKRVRFSGGDWRNVKNLRIEERGLGRRTIRRSLHLVQVLGAPPHRSRA